MEESFKRIAKKFTYAIKKIVKKIRKYVKKKKSYNSYKMLLKLIIFFCKSKNVLKVIHQCKTICKKLYEKF